MARALKSIPYSKNGNSPRFVYALVDPRSSRIRYVGCSYNPKKRMESQLTEARARRSNPKYAKVPDNFPPRLRWLTELIDGGNSPIVVILEECEYSEWRERENYWIVTLHEAGADLTNIRTSAGFDNIEHENYRRIYRSGNRNIRLIFTADGVRAIDITDN